MAARRPASSRARNPPMPPPAVPAPRARSVMAKPVSQTATSEAGESSGTQNQAGGGGTNIQVVVRCRNRSEREIQDNSPIIVHSSGAKSKDLSIEAGTPTSSLGVVTAPPTRTYPFDLVFGPEADQAMIYHEVVSPMLDQVLQGYNCTLFAYGQTGTGKTYTMQGDLARTPMGNPSSHAGMIPRVLFRLFHQLESSGADYSVKISYVELYNEELRDLLATDFSAPSGSTQPMGMASKDKDNGLKIFDDTGKKGGVFIQGLEEIAVKDSRDALALLVKGSERRQIAATNFNDHSSRSHSVFSITVHTKDTAYGEDLLKTGKLHMVDLAGSENIGRSGAENKRAREAGMINQSLLTLGRVINALVDKAQHVPYRESKLTRLLQDSLGGRTKTCIIATISPARSNIEETLSTLDYALRAKSIRNKPEVNQRMTRNALLKEYVAEIDRLKADLLAAREKNGIFFSEETMAQMNAEQELRKTELVEARKQVEIVEKQLRNVREEYDQSIGLLMQREDQLKETRTQLANTQNRLAQREEDLKATKNSLKEEELIRKAYQDSEANLNGVATDLKSTVYESTNHVEGLHAKLDRKSGVLSSNKRAVNKYGKETLSSANAVASSIEGHNAAASQIHTNLVNEAQQLASSTKEALESGMHTLQERGESSRSLFDKIQADDESENKLFAGLEQDLQTAHSAFETQMTSWRSTVQVALTQTCTQTGTTIKGHNATVEQSVDGLHSALEEIVRKARQYLAEQRDILAEMKQSADQQSSSEVARLKEENEWLSSIVNEERKKAEASKDQLIHRISGLLGSFLQERDASLRAAVEDVKESHNAEAEESQAYYSQQDKRMLGLGDKSQIFESTVQMSSREGKRKREAIDEAVRNTNQALDTSLGELKGSTSKAIETLSSNVSKQQRSTITTFSSSMEEYSRIKRARMDKTDELQGNVEADHELAQTTLSSAYDGVEAFASSVTTNVSTLGDLSSEHLDAVRRNVDVLQKNAQAVLDKGARDDQPTGQTPQKRSWEYPEEWELTQSRDAILGEFRGAQAALMEAANPKLEAVETLPQAPVQQHKRTSTSTSDIENSVPATPVEQEVISPPPPPSGLPTFPAKTRESLREKRQSTYATETLVDSRKRNVSTRSRR